MCCWFTPIRILSWRIRELYSLQQIGVIFLPTKDPLNATPDTWVPDLHSHFLGTFDNPPAAIATWQLLNIAHWSIWGFFFFLQYRKLFCLYILFISLKPPHILAKVASDSKNTLDMIPSVYLGEINMCSLAMLGNLDLFQLEGKINILQSCFKEKVFVIMLLPQGK